VARAQRTAPFHARADLTPVDRLDEVAWALMVPVARPRRVEVLAPQPWADAVVWRELVQPQAASPDVELLRQTPAVVRAPVRALLRARCSVIATYQDQVPPSVHLCRIDHRQPKLAPRSPRSPGSLGAKATHQRSEESHYVAHIAPSPNRNSALHCPANSSGGGCPERKSLRGKRQFDGSAGFARAIRYREPTGELRACPYPRLRASRGTSDAARVSSWHGCGSCG